MSQDPPIPARFKILLELLREGPLRASDLVDTTGLTLQGVSYNLEKLEDEGLVRFEEARAARITEQGVEALHEHFLGLKAFVDYALGEMLHVEECVAIAGMDLEPGDEVGLFMEHGRLVARKEESPSKGRIRKGGHEGSIVTVSGLTGVVDLEPGTVDVVQLPPPLGLPQAKRLRELSLHADEHDVVVTSGLEARTLVENANLSIEQGPIPFAPEQVARSAAHVGLNVLLVAAWKDAERLTRALREGEGVHGRSIPVHLHTMDTDT